MVDGSSSPTNRHQLYILQRRGSNGGGVFLVNWREMLKAQLGEFHIKESVTVCVGRDFGAHKFSP